MAYRKSIAYWNYRNIIIINIRGALSTYASSLVMCYHINCASHCDFLCTVGSLSERPVLRGSGEARFLSSFGAIKI